MKLQVGVKVLLQNQSGYYLLIRRSGSHDGVQFDWDIPGGRIHEDEPLVDALKREVAEETGLTLSDDPVLFYAQDIFVQKADLHVVRLTYTAHADGEVRLSDEHTDLQWIDPDDILLEPDLDPYLRKALEVKNERI